MSQKLTLTVALSVVAVLLLSVAIQKTAAKEEIKTCLRAIPQLLELLSEELGGMDADEAIDKIISGEIGDEKFKQMEESAKTKHDNAWIDELIAKATACFQKADE